MINANDSYKFEVPSSYREVGVANIQSGNFCMVSMRYIIFLMYHARMVHRNLPAHCVSHAILVSVYGKGMCLQPNCAEPWTEIVFADDKEGKVQVCS